jgi:hypothetical protein
MLVPNSELRIPESLPIPSRSAVRTGAHISLEPPKDVSMAALALGDGLGDINADEAFTRMHGCQDDFCDRA